MEKSNDVRREPQTPKGETGWLRICDADGNDRFMITSDVMRSEYYIYDTTVDPPKRLAKNANPKMLENKYATPPFASTGAAQSAKSAKNTKKTKAAP